MAKRKHLTLKPQTMGDVVQKYDRYMEEDWRLLLRAERAYQKARQEYRRALGTILWTHRRLGLAEQLSLILKEPAAGDTTHGTL